MNPKLHYEKHLQLEKATYQSPLNSLNFNISKPTEIVSSFQVWKEVNRILPCTTLNLYYFVHTFSVFFILLLHMIILHIPLFDFLNKRTVYMQYPDFFINAESYFTIEQRAKQMEVPWLSHLQDSLDVGRVCGISGMAHLRNPLHKSCSASSTCFVLSTKVYTVDIISVSARMEHWQAVRNTGRPVFRIASAIPCVSAPVANGRKFLGGGVRVSHSL
jgi:hypothetical protein